ncbi:hypothetical protein YC2023_118914 [Brassica napus]
MALTFRCLVMILDTIIWETKRKKPRKAWHMHDTYEHIPNSAQQLQENTSSHEQHTHITKANIGEKQITTTA